MDGTLLERTRALLELRNGTTLEDISEASGVGIHWLRKFACGQITNPTVNNLQQLHDYLAKHIGRAA